MGSSSEKHGYEKNEDKGEQNSAKGQCQESAFVDLDESCQKLMVRASGRGWWVIYLNDWQFLFYAR